MTIKVNLKAETLTVNYDNGYEPNVYCITCRVRQFRNSTREAGEVVRTIPDGVPYDPLPFPKGKWKITGVEYQEDAGFDLMTYGPVKIKTDAWQLVKTCVLDEEGDYAGEIAAEVADHGYWIHYSQSGSTLGCIRMGSAGDALELAELIEDFKGTVTLEVI